MYLVNGNKKFGTLEFFQVMTLVTQKQVLELYITAIECKTLYSLHVPHTAFPNATIATMNPTTKVHATKDRGIRTSHMKWCLMAIITE